MPLEDARSETLSRALLEIIAHPERLRTLHRALGEFCHEFRNRLNSLNLALYITRRSALDPGADTWQRLEREYREVERFIELFQTICRPMRLTPVKFALGTVLKDRLATWADWLAAGGRRLETEPPHGSAVGCFDPIRLLQGLDAFASWRSQAGQPGMPVRLAWWEREQHLHLRWVEPGERVTGGPHGRCERAACLALPLLARVMSAHGGTLDISDPNPLQVQLRWPCEAPAGSASLTM